MEKFKDLDMVLREKCLASAGSAVQEESESGMGDEVELVCPYCFEEPFNFSSLGDHIHEEHSGQQRASVKCPACRKPQKDLLQHLALHKHRSQDLSCGASSSSGQASSSCGFHNLMDWKKPSRLADSLYREDLDVEEVNEAFSSIAVESSQTFNTLDKRKKAAASGGHELAVRSNSQEQLARKGEKLKPVVSKTERPMLQDSPALRKDFVRGLLLSALELDWR